MAGVPASLPELSARLDDVSEALATLSEKVGYISRTVEPFFGRLDDVSNTLDTVSGRVDNLAGTAYISRATRGAPRRMELPGEVTAIFLRYQDRRHNALWMEELAKAAMPPSEVTPQEADNVARRDLVFTNSHRGGDETLAAAEVSTTVQVHEVERVELRAAIPARIQALAVTTVTIGAAFEADALQRAASSGVTHVKLEPGD